MSARVPKPIDPAVLFDTLGHHYRPPVEPDAVVSRPSDARAGLELGDDVKLPSVEGLDTADGLMRVAGNRRLYLKLLRQFVDQQAEAPLRIGEALTAGDRAVAERLAHTVKGVAGNLWARRVHAAAGAPQQGI